MQDLKTTASQSVKVCPSKLLACPKKSTCCPGPYIGYDCCPLSQGVCCEDFQHCCPYNSSCHAKAKQCISNTGVKFPWVRKLKAERTPGTRIKKYNMISKKVTSSNGICPRNTINRCHEDHTCCIINGGNHGCCPIINAVCCNDGTHCCPKGSVCSSNSTCVGKIKNKFGGIPINEELLSTNSSPTNDNIWQKKPFSKSQNVNATIICPGGQYSCPSGTSCCPSTKGTYGCCPFAVSVCCADKWHCCPAGFVCDLEKNVCTRGGLFIPLFSAARGYEGIYILMYPLM